MQNIKSDTFVCNAKTGETATRWTAVFRCECPSCGDGGAHHGTGESARASKPGSGIFRLVCGWCGHGFDGPAVPTA